MALKQIPNLPPVLGLAGAEQFELVQAGVSSRVALDQIHSFVRDRLPTARISIGVTPPYPATNGQLWFYTADEPAGGELYIYYVDGDSGQWIPASPSGDDDDSDSATSIITPEMYGAVGDGVFGPPAIGTDDTKAFKDALAALESMGGGTLHCGPRHYMIDLPGNQQILYNASNITILGVPGRTILDFSRTTGFYGGDAGIPGSFIATAGTKHDGATANAAIMLTNDTIASEGMVAMVTTATRSGAAITVSTDAAHGLAIGNLVWVLGDPGVTGEDLGDLDILTNSQQCFYTVTVRTLGRTVPFTVTGTPTATSFTYTYGGDLTGMDTVLDPRAVVSVRRASDVMAVPDSAIFSRGERVLIGSLDERGRDNEHCNIGEYQTIGKILSPTLVRFQANVRDSYLMAHGARVFKLTQIVNPSFDGLTIVGKGRNLGTGRGDAAISLTQSHNLVVRRCTFIDCDLMSVFIFYSSKAMIEGNVVIFDQRDQAGGESGQIDIQYGFNFGACIDDFTARDNTVLGGRHAFVQGGSVSDSDFGTAGVCRFLNNYCTGQWLDPISTHQGADTLIYDGNVLRTFRGGINPRFARDVTISNNLITADHNAIVLYNDVLRVLISGNVLDAGNYPIQIKSIDNPTANAQPDGYSGNVSKLSRPTPAGPSIQITGNQIRNGIHGIYCIDTTPGLVVNGIEITDNSFYRSRNEAVRVSIGYPTATSVAVAASGSSYDNATGITTLVLATPETHIGNGGRFTLSAMAGSSALSVALLNGEHGAISPTTTIDTISFTAAAGLGTITITAGGTIVVPTGESAVILDGTYTSATGASTLRVTSGFPDLAIGNPFTLAGLQGTGAVASLNGAQTASAATTSLTTVTFKDTSGNGATTITGGTLTLSLGGWTGSVSNNRFYDCCLTQSTYQLRFSNAQRVKINDNLLLGTSTYPYALWLEGDTTTACEMMGNSVAPTLYATAVIHPGFFGTGHKTDMFFREDVTIAGGVAALKCVTTRHLRLRMESGSADDLVSITGAGVDQELTLSTQATNWNITVKHGAGFELAGDSDKLLNNTLDRLRVMWSPLAAKFVQTVPLMDHDGPLVGTRLLAITYYVSTTGSDLNDGLTAGAPVLTFQKAMELCELTAAYSKGPFTIQAAAGTYTVTAELFYRSWMFSGCPITFKGHVTAGVPDVIVQGSTDGTRTLTFIGANDIIVSIQDYFFKSFDTVADAGTTARVSLQRVWARNCRVVLVPHNGGHGGAQGGDWDGRDLAGVIIPDGWAFSTVIVGPFDLSQASDYTGLLIHHYDYGVVVDECGSGHLDYLRIEDCNVGVWIIRQGGSPNFRFARIWRCVKGVLAEDSAALSISATFDFGQGTANACTDNIVNCAGPVTPQARETGYSSRPVYLVWQNIAGGNLTNSIVERNLSNPLIQITRGRVRLCDVIDVHLHTRGNLTTDGTIRLYFDATMVKSWVVPTGTQTARIEINLEAINGTDWRGQIHQLAGPDGSPPATLLTAIDPDVLGITSKTAETVVSLTWQAGALADAFRVKVLRLYSSIAGLGFP